MNPVRDRVLSDVKADFPGGLAGLGGRHELADGLKQRADGGVVALDALFEFSQLEYFPVSFCGVNVVRKN